MTSTNPYSINIDSNSNFDQAQPAYGHAKLTAPSLPNNPVYQAQPFVQYNGQQATVTYTSIPIAIVQVNEPENFGRQGAGIPGVGAITEQEGNPMHLTTNPKGSNPQWFYCTNCKKAQLSEVRYKVAAETWLLLILFIILAVFLFFIFIFIPSCQKAVHYCPECIKRVGKSKYLF